MTECKVSTCRHNDSKVHRCKIVPYIKMETWFDKDGRIVYRSVCQYNERPRV